MAKVLIELPDDLIQYMEEDPYVGDQGQFLTMLIRRWIRDKENSTRRQERQENDPTVIWN
jgi:hypothetical protein